MHKRQVRLLKFRQNNELLDPSQVLAKFAPKPKKTTEEYVVTRIEDDQVYQLVDHDRFK
jgi:hypothetical protein